MRNIGKVGLVLYGGWLNMNTDSKSVPIAISEREVKKRARALFCFKILISVVLVFVLLY